jgi:putative membrane protein
MADAPAPKSAPDPRNRLARIRTELANERTLLSYGRTALGFAIAGASALHFLEGAPAWSLGTFLMLAGLTILIVGAKRFVDVRSRICRTPIDPASEEDRDLEHRIRGY